MHPVSLSFQGGWKVAHGKIMVDLNAFLTCNYGAIVKQTSGEENGYAKER